MKTTMKIKFNNYFETLNRNCKKILHFVFNIFNTKIEGNEDTLKGVHDLEKQVSPSLRFTYIIIGVALGFFIIWGGLAKLDSATVAPGFVALSGNHKTIQHLEGGVIDKILIKEGDFVEENQSLVILNETMAKARLQMILSQLRAAKAIESRLLAEKHNKSSVDYSDLVYDEDIPEVKKIITMQNALFKTRMQSVKGKLNILSQKVIQYKEQIKGLEILKEALGGQLVILKEETGSMQNLFDKAYASKSDLLDLKKRALEIEGRLGEIIGNLGSVNESIAETELQMLDFENDNQNEINDLMQKAQAQILDLQEQYEASKDVLARTVIKAPQSGIITGLQYHTIGGVIAPGAKIMDIVPQNDELIVEAHIMPRDIESIKLGLRTKVQLSAFKSRLVPRVDGEVIYFSANRIEDEKTRHPYYVARIRIEPEALDKINYDVKLHPGMPADVFIVKGERTFLQYMVSPITDSLHRAFKEK